MPIVLFDQETQRYMTSNIYQLKTAIDQARLDKDPWKAVDIIVKAFREKFPKRYKSYVVRLEKLRKSEKVTQVGNKRFRGVSKVEGTYTAHTVDFPAWIMTGLRKVFTTKELIMDQEFFREFAARYPEYRIMERV